MSDNLFTIPFLAGVIFVMIFSYAAEGIIFSNTLSIGTPETNQKYENIRGFNSEENPATYPSFYQFLDINYKRAGDLYTSHGPAGWINIIYSSTYDLKKGEVATLIGFMYEHYDPFYYNGVTWYQAKKDLPSGIPAADTIGKYCISEYNIYLSIMKKTLSSGLNAVLNFIGMIPTYFGVLADLLTFNIKDSTGVNVFPAAVQFIILVFMIPLWILLLIGILPFIIGIINAIGVIIPDWL